MARPQTISEALPGVWGIIRHFSPYIRKQRGLIAGSTFALFAEVALRALEPLPLKFVFDYVIAPKAGGGTLNFAAIKALDPVTLLTFAALAVVALIGLRAVAAYLNTVGFALVGNRVLTEVRTDLYRHLQCLSLSFHNRARGGDLLIRVISDIGMLRDIAVTALLPLAANVLILFCMAGLMFWFDWKLAALALATVPLFWLFTARVTGQIQKVSRDQRKREGAMASTAAESMGAIRVVQALSLEETFAGAFSSHNEKSLKEGVKGSRLSASLERTVDVLIAIATALVLWYGAHLVLRGEMTGGDLLVFLAYLKNAFKPVQDFAKYTGRIAKATAAGERIIELFNQTPDVKDLPGAVTAPALRGAVKFESVDFSYEPGQLMLKGIDLDVKPGEHVAIVGPSGNGKSTLVNLILRLYDPVSGRIQIDGRDIREYTLDSLRTQIGIVLQDSVLFAASVRDNIAYGAADATPEEIEAAARVANAHDFIEQMPEGYDTILGERGVTISAGQRQRIAIARAAVRRAAILIQDEPTTGLDGENERLVMQALDRLAVGKTTFLISHSLRHAVTSDIVIYVENGRIAERGTHTELIGAGGRYAALYKLQENASTSFDEADIKREEFDAFVA